MRYPDHGGSGTIWMEFVMSSRSSALSSMPGGKWIARGIVFAAAVAIPATAVAAPAPCGQRKDLLAQLVERYHEAPVAVGLANNGALVEVLTSDDGSTWTILITRANGISCLVAAGESWQKLETVAADDPGV